jgi:hypothetical protein
MPSIPQAVLKLNKFSDFGMAQGLAFPKRCRLRMRAELEL